VERPPKQVPDRVEAWSSAIVDGRHVAIVPADRARAFPRNRCLSLSRVYQSADDY
jgi:hypothetical protein